MFVCEQLIKSKCRNHLLQGFMQVFFRVQTLISFNVRCSHELESCFAHILSRSHVSPQRSAWKTTCGQDSFLGQLSNSIFLEISVAAPSAPICSPHPLQFSCYSRGGQKASLLSISPQTTLPFSFPGTRSSSNVPVNISHRPPPLSEQVMYKVMPPPDPQYSLRSLIFFLPASIFHTVIPPTRSIHYSRSIVFVDGGGDIPDAVTSTHSPSGVRVTLNAGHRSPSLRQSFVLGRPRVYVDEERSRI